MIKLPTGSNMPKQTEAIAVTEAPKAPQKVVNVTGRYIAPSKPIKTTRLKTTSDTQLTVRESEILALILKGLSNAAIASVFNCAVGTVKFHKTNIYLKRGVSNIAQLRAKELANA